MLMLMSWLSSLAHKLLMLTFLLMLASLVRTGLKQTTTETPTGTSPNKRFNEQNNTCACSLSIFVHFDAVLCKTTTVVKLPSFAYFGEPRPRRQIFRILLWN